MTATLWTGYVDGTYRMSDGSMVQDQSLKVWVAVPPDRVDELRILARRIAARLKQEALWFETSDAEVEFLPPLWENGEAP